MRFAHVPVTFDKRKHGTSFVSLSYPFKVLLQILILLATLKPMHIFVPVGTFFLCISFSVSIFEIIIWLFVNGVKPIEHVNFVLGNIITWISLPLSLFFYFHN
jgi:hypothetical protein